MRQVFFLCLLCWALLPGLTLAAASGQGAGQIMGQAGAQTLDQTKGLLLQNAFSDVVLFRPASEGFCFGIRYIHSVAQSPVEDWFRVLGGVIHLEKTIYQDFGAGLPHDPGPGQTMRSGNGHMVISGYQQPLPRFDLRVGHVARHTLLLPRVPGQCEDAEREEILFSSLARPGSAVSIGMGTAATGNGEK